MPHRRPAAAARRTAYNAAIRTLITGSGMVASALLDACRARGWDAALLPRRQADVTDFSAVLAELSAWRPQLVFHTAALTRVNYCEAHPDEALAVNAGGTANVARAAAQLEAQLVYFSTDYVFDGARQQSYLEQAAPRPLNAYGASKLAGEEAARLCPRASVVRISGVFGPRLGGGERNFVRAIWQQLAAGRPEVRVVADQRTALTYAPHLARMLLELQAEGGLPALLHLTSAGADTWYGWARQVAQAAGADPRRIVPGAAKPAAARPTCSVLGTGDPRAARLIAAHPAQEGIAEYVGMLQPPPH